jgi:uncharacterized protein (DUF697 family)
MASGKRGFPMGDLIGKIPAGKLFEAAKDVAGVHGSPVRVAILVDRNASTDIVRTLQGLFESENERALLRVEALPANPSPIDTVADLVVIVAAESRIPPTLMASAVAAGVPAVVCCACADACYRSMLDTSFPLEPDDIVGVDDAADHDRFGEDLGAWIVDRCHESRLALAAAFPFIRRPLAVEYAHSTAAQNAAIGAIPLIPGADMPLMTLNEGKMVLKMAAAYGHPIEPARVIEITVAVLGGFGARRLVRFLSHKAPSLTWVVSGMVGWTSTLALGYAMSAYFEAGGMPKDLSTAISEVVGSAHGVMPFGRKTGFDDTPTIDVADGGVLTMHPVDIRQDESGIPGAIFRDAVSDRES